MAFGINFAIGQQRLIDAQMNFVRAGLPVFLRLRNFTDVQSQEFSQLGFSSSPSGTLATGTTDILITPPPSVTMVSLHNIGQSSGKLRFGARNFLISNTFVKNQIQSQGLSIPNHIWIGSKVVGLVTDGQLFSIEDYSHQEVAGLTVTWLLTCNANELR